MSRRKTKTTDQAVSQIRTPPHSLEAEQSVLGGLMLDNQAWEKVSAVLQMQDFYQTKHRIIFNALQQLATKYQPLDVLTVTEYLKMSGQLEEMGGEISLYELVKNTPSAANILAYADIVRERSVLRQLIEASTQITEHAFQPGEANSTEVLDQAEKLIFQIAERRRIKGVGPIRISDLLKQAVEKIDTLAHTEGNLTGLASGYKDLDEMTTGLQAADLVIVAGRPSMGKTSFAMNIAEYAAIKNQEEKKPGIVLVFSMEMPGESLAMRMLSSLGRIDHHRMRTGKLQDNDWPRIKSAVNMLSATQLFIDDTPALSPNDLRSRVRNLAREQNMPLSLIVVDYLQLMRIQGFNIGNRVGEISEISRALKATAKELNVPIIALSQLNRGLEQRLDKRPQMSDLRESGAIEQDADLILFIYRDEVYHPDSADKGIAEIIIAKQRNGPIGKVKLTFLGKYTRFENYASANMLGFSPKPPLDLNRDR